MSKVMIEVTEQTAFRLLAKSASQGVSIASLLERVSLEMQAKAEEQSSPLKASHQVIEEKPTPVRDSEWFQEAVKRVKEQEAGSTFSLRTLFSPEEWDQLPSPRVFGRLFREAIEPTYATRDGDDEEWNIAKYVRNAVN